MKEYILFLKDKSLLSALLIILLIETSMQFGCYKTFLKRNSYASNVNQITDHAISRKNEIDPDILIIGTSLAYEGISLEMLNNSLKPLNLKAQSVAIPGSELIIQQLAIEKALKEFKNVKYIIHVNEAETPWTLATLFSTPTLAMAGEFNRIRALEKFKEDEYNINFVNVSNLLIRLWAYRHDLKDFILNPQKRIKDIGKSRKTFNENLYNYTNTNLESLDFYSFKTLDEAIEITQGNAEIAKGSSHYHKEAIYKTCKLAKETDISVEENESTRLFKRRLNNFYTVIREKNIKIINVFPPFSIYLEHFRHPQRIKFWEERYKDILGDKILNLSNSIPHENNASYYYDIVHLNQKGMNIFTEKLSESLIPYLLESKEESR